MKLKEKIYLNCGHEVESMDEVVNVEYVEDGGLVYAAFCKDCAAESWLVEAELGVRELKKKWGIE